MTVSDEDIRIDEIRPRPEAEVRERIEQLRFERICARELRGDPN